jgi:hypothetical protein
MKEEIEKLQLRITELENQLKSAGAQSAKIDPEEMKIFNKVLGQLGWDPDNTCGPNECRVCIVNCISSCRVCKVCTTCVVCRTCTVCNTCVVCRVCKVCTVCIHECSCGPCIAKTPGLEGFNQFEDLGL